MHLGQFDFYFFHSVHFIASLPQSGRVQTSISPHQFTPCVDFVLDLLTIRQPVVKGMQRLAISRWFLFVDVQLLRSDVGPDTGGTHITSAGLD